MAVAPVPAAEGLKVGTDLEEAAKDLEVGPDCKAGKVLLRQTSVTHQHVFRQCSPSNGNDEGGTQAAQG